MSLLKSVGKFIASPVTAPLSLAKNTFLRPFNQTWQIINDIDNQKVDQNNQERIAEMISSRESLLEEWGVKENEVNKVKRGLLFETISFTIISIFPVIGLISDTTVIMFWMAALVATPLCLFVATTKLWRYECIIDGRLTPYKDWIKFGDKNV